MSTVQRQLELMKCHTTQLLLGFVMLGLIGACGPSTDTDDGLGISPAELQQLESLGYINQAEVDPEEAARRGVVLWNREAAWPGFNLYSSGARREAELMAMDGRVVHRWASETVGRAYTRFKEELGEPPWYMNGWERLWLRPDGGLVVNSSHHLLLALDRDSRVELSSSIATHHDFALTADGGYLLIVDAPRQVDLEGELYTVTDNHLLTLDAEGREISRLSVLDALLATPELRPTATAAVRATRERQQTRLTFFERALSGAEGLLATQLERRHELYAEALDGRLEHEAELKTVLLHHPATDILHSNSIQIVPAAVPELWPAGSLLLCVNRLNLLLVLERESGGVLWHWGPGVVDLPHHATQEPGGTILLFDNGSGRKYSRVLEIDPGSREIVWEYRGDPPESFFSNSRGGAQLLPNGNVLVTETDRGRVFEVTRACEIVWEFFNPDVDGARRGTIYRMTRFSAEEATAAVGAQRR